MSNTPAIMDLHIDLVLCLQWTTLEEPLPCSRTLDAVSVTPFGTLMLTSRNISYTFLNWRHSVCLHDGKESNHCVSTSFSKTKLNFSNIPSSSGWGSIFSCTYTFQSAANWSWKCVLWPFSRTAYMWRGKIRLPLDVTIRSRVSMHLICTTDCKIHGCSLGDVNCFFWHWLLKPVVNGSHIGNAKLNIALF